ncbi:glutathione S-transferase [Lentithecium fluviatile CBS 122367]|uniref:Glutathione S-transferase n=1 Tax=Lentithecium fluviatile CBS 122367 TaxID=1168545 RepID=A0A6G1J3R0_9PLEO|nr:glutathione S-transferase [Lentithecium fluviatile CBS 122367]
MSTPTPKLTLHHLQIGQGERIPFLLEELGLPYELKLYKRSPLLSPAELKEKHHMGASPVLEDATFDPDKPIMLAESGAIAEYLIHKHGHGRVALPPSHPNFADYLYWFHFSNASLQPAIFRLALTRGMVGPEDPRFKGNEARVRTAVANVNNRLLENKYLAGEEFTAADVMTMWCFTTMRKFEPLDLTGYEGILGWLERVSKRGAYRRAMERCDPELDLEAGISAEGPSVVELFAKAMAGRK